MDERVKEEYRKIYAGLIPWIVVINALSILIKFGILEWSPESCITELIVLVFASLYMFVGCAMKGLALKTDRGQRIKRFVTSLVTALIVYGIMFFARGKALDQNALSFVFWFAVSYLVATVLSHGFLNLRAKKVEEKYCEKNLDK